VPATGGTIAGHSDGGGAATARDAGADLIARLDLPPGIEVLVEDVFTVSGFRMTLDRVHTLARAVAAQLRDPGVAGVVVTHGTDTTEETAFFPDIADRAAGLPLGRERPPTSSEVGGRSALRGGRGRRGPAQLIAVIRSSVGADSGWFAPR
jgi:L-asparaginase